MYIFSCMKKVNKEGKVYYYYYKKKIGRKKKRGVKAKKKKNTFGTGKDRTWNYKILRFDFRKQSAYIGAYRTIEDAYKVKAELMKQNKSVEFPVTYTVSKRFNCGTTETNSIYAILKKIKEEGESNKSMLRNEYGKLVEHITTSNKYYIIDKFPCLVEETFWVYGHHPITDRKTYNWIYTNFIDEVYDTTLSLVNIHIYNNKVIFRYDGDEFNFVICKNISDSIRMYSLLRKKYEKNKRVLFTGQIFGHSDRGRELIKMLKEKTGWSDYKIYRTTTAK